MANRHGVQGMTSDPIAFGTVIRDERRKRGLSQDGLASLCGMSRAYVGEIERGKVNVSLSTLEALARGLNLSLAEVIESYERQAR